jgi:hypothetical protein
MIVSVGLISLVVAVVGGKGKALRSRKGERRGKGGRTGEGSGDIVAEGEESEMADMWGYGAANVSPRLVEGVGETNVGEEGCSSGGIGEEDVGFSVGGCVALLISSVVRLPRLRLGFRRRRDRRRKMESREMMTRAAQPPKAMPIMAPCARLLGESWDGNEDIAGSEGEAEGVLGLEVIGFVGDEIDDDDVEELDFDGADVDDCSGSPCPTQ